MNPKMIIVPVAGLLLGLLLTLVSTPQKAHAAGESCFATINSTTVYSSTDASAVQSAVDAASPSDLVKVAGTCAGVQNVSTFTQTVYINTADITLQGGYTTTNWITPDADAYPTVLDAQGQGRVAFIATKSHITLDRLTLTGGDGTLGGGGTYGGAIRLVSEATLNLSNTVLQKNTAQRGGVLSTSKGTVNLTDSLLISNTASFRGGTLYGESSSSFTLTNTLVLSNTAAQGGAMNASHTTDITLVDSAVAYNTGTDLAGAIMNFGDTLLIRNSTIHHNTTPGQGGAIYNVSDGIVQAYNSTISNNSAGNFGAIYHANTALNIELVNTTVADNTATNGVGGIRLGAGLFTMRNTILANSGTNCVVSGGSISSGGYNLSTDATCQLTATGDQANADPRLAPLAKYGGGTPSHALLPGSPAINAGENGTCLPTDQRGIGRPQQAQCDIGAVESQGFTLAISGGTNQTTPIESAFGSPLALSISSNGGNEPVDGGMLTFVAPASGASTSFAPTTTAAIASGAASLNTMANPVVGGPYDVTATARGGNSVNFSLTNAKSTTMVAVTSSANPALRNQTVTFTATVTGTVPSSLGIPSGSVTFLMNGAPQPPVPLVNGRALFSIASLAAGTHTITANYSGDANFSSGSASIAGGQTVLNAAPFTPSTPSPLNGSTGISTTQTLTWQGGDPDGDVVTYTVAYGANNTPPITETTTLTTFTPSLQPGTTYFWRITASDGISESTGALWSFTTEVGSSPENGAPFTPANPTPLDDSTNISITQALTWQGGDPDGDVVTYTVAIGANNTPPITETTTLTRFTPLLLPGTTYFWRITASDGVSERAGPLWSFTTGAASLPGNGAPFAPSNPSPLDGSTGISTTQALTWQGGDPDGDVVTYTVAFGANNTPPITETTTLTTFTPTLLPGTTYFWRITASDGRRESAGPLWSFTTETVGGADNGAPFTPSNPTPPDASSGVSIAQVLSWQGGDPDGDPVTYTIAFGSDSQPPVVQSTTSTSFTPSLLPGTTYFWRISASDGSSVRPGPIWSFTTSSTATGGTRFIYLPVIQQ